MRHTGESVRGCCRGMRSILERWKVPCAPECSKSAPRLLASARPPGRRCPRAGSEARSQVPLRGPAGHRHEARMAAGGHRMELRSGHFRHACVQPASDLHLQSPDRPAGHMESLRDSCGSGTAPSQPKGIHAVVRTNKDRWSIRRRGGAQPPNGHWFVESASVPRAIPANPPARRPTSGLCSR